MTAFEIQTVKLARAMASYENITTFDMDPPLNNSVQEENLTSLYISFSFLGLLGVFIIVANAMVFTLFAKRSYLRTKSNVFLVSLAASDFSAGILCIPLVIACNVFRESFYGWIICLGMDLSQRFLAISTILHLLAATLERYLKILLPLRYLSVLTSRKVAIVLLVIWSTALFSSFIQLTWIDIKSSAMPGHSQQIDAFYLVVCAILFVFIPFVIMVYAYLRIFCVIWGERRPSLLLESTKAVPARRVKRKKSNEIRATCIYIAMAIMFLFAWSGYFFAGIMDDIQRESVKNFPQWLNIVLLFLKFSTALVNPLLYTFFKTDFQNALGSFKEQAANSLAASAQFFSANTFENERNHNECSAQKGRNSSEPDHLLQKPKNTRSYSFPQRNTSTKV